MSTRPRAVPTFMIMMCPKKRLKRCLSRRVKIVRVERAREWQLGKPRPVATSESSTVRTVSPIASL